MLPSRWTATTLKPTTRSGLTRSTSITGKIYSDKRARSYGRALAFAEFRESRGSLLSRKGSCSFVQRLRVDVGSPTAAGRKNRDPQIYLVRRLLGCPVSRLTCIRICTPYVHRNVLINKRGSLLADRL